MDLEPNEIATKKPNFSFFNLVKRLYIRITIIKDGIMLPKKIDKKLKFSKFSLKNPINQKYSGGFSGYSL